MKKITRYTIILFSIYSCQLTDVLDNDPPNNLVSENIVQNKTDAEVLLNGIYVTLTKTIHHYRYTELVPSTLIGTASYIQGKYNFITRKRTPTEISTQLTDNKVLFNNDYSSESWKYFYNIIDGANNTIFQTTNLSKDLIEDSSRKEIIGEARALRGMATFNLLRYFGQFFDLNSNLGIVLRTEPSNYTNKDKARNTVTECYAQILSDLDAAIADAPDYTVSYRASKTTAKAIKARVLLYQGKYAEAVALADDVINEGKTKLEADFETAFSKGLESTEMILMSYRDATTEEQSSIIFSKKGFSGAAASDNWFTTLMDSDPRKDLTYSGTTILKTNNKDTFRPTYYLRLSEMYLIKAEALAFSGGSLADASTPLNIIRNRAGIGDTPATTIEALKDDIFNEYVRELCFENGAEWFAAIRFNKAMELKPSITSSDQYILPIPETEIINNRKVSLANQNPGYE